jgi:hypothetical protein
MFHLDYVRCLRYHCYCYPMVTALLSLTLHYLSQIMATMSTPHSSLPLEPPHILNVNLSGVNLGQDLPLNQVLLFPPFPPIPPFKELQAFQAFEQRGVSKSLSPYHHSYQTLQSGPAQLQLPLVSLEGSNQNAAGSSSKKGPISITNAWKIGEESSDWVEPVATRIHAYDT